jgi:hypothetical protein
MWATSVIAKITAQSKQSLTGQKFAQSGHPDLDRAKIRGDSRK